MGHDACVHVFAFVNFRWKRDRELNIGHVASVRIRGAICFR